MKNTLLITGILVALVILLSIGCSKNNVETITGQSATTCDNDTVNMKYNENIVPLMKLHCYYCHGDANTAGSGGINLATYDNLKLYADNSKLLGDLFHAPGFVPMPYGMPKLSDCDLNVFLDWVQNGAQNN
ncbi:MAG TPA: hypothetical protein VK559_04830 [Ferruginibacter sp.]|nr:hypothetical protein [Ferruginibacter sp.]